MVSHIFYERVVRLGRKTVYNNVTSPELLEKVNLENKKLLTDFLMYLSSIQRSPTTISSYKSDIEIFWVWNLLNNNNKFFIDITKRDIIAYQNYLINENKNSPARVRRMKSALSSMSNYVESVLDEEYSDFKPIVRKIESPINQPVREKTVLTENQLDLLLSTLVQNKEYLKSCLVALAAFSGSRKAELVRFKADYFNDVNIIYGFLYKTPEKIKTKGRGHGKYLYKYILATKFKPYLDLWMRKRQELDIDSEWLFTYKDKNNEWQQLKTTTLDGWTESFSKILDVPFYWHACRHYYTTNLVRLNLPDHVIQEIIGWDSAEMIRVYTDIETDEYLGKYFDKNGIKQIETIVQSDLR